MSFNLVCTKKVGKYAVGQTITDTKEIDALSHGATKRNFVRIRAKESAPAPAPKPAPSK